MYRITTNNGRVGHIAGSIVDTNDGRVVTTVCGQTHPETDYHVDDSLDACSGCDKKFYNLVDADDASVLDSEAKVEEPAKTEKPKAAEPKTTSTKDK